MTAGSAPSVRARSFGAVAAAYDRFRPAPPADAVAWVLPDPCRTALDVGAGTGALTRRLVDRADRVLAVEPDPRMLEVLTARSPGVGAVQASAENLPVASGSVDCVTVSSAWHWMEADRATAEIGRVLRPGGVLGVVWNGADRSVDWVAAVLRRRDPSPAERRPTPAGHRFELPEGSGFADLEATLVTWSLPVTADELVGLAGTYSSVITMAPEAKVAELDRVRAVLGAYAPGAPVVLPMACRCWRAVRT
ncbi:MAG: class I SAM-dependent methyltransferase, partial [Acidimicrobiales bacterium]